VIDPSGGESESSKVEKFATLLATCQRQVFLYVMGLVHHAADAEEVLQETNLVLWRKFHEYQPATEFGRWACSVAYYEVLKLREKKMRHQQLFSNEFVESLAAAGPPSADALQSRREALQGCLAKLNQEDRQLILSRYQPAANTRSVAKSLGRSAQGTRRALHRIRTALLACIERTLSREGAL
jgi:RNA polymerase sigma-70 factor (ECF subfamily)